MKTHPTCLKPPLAGLQAGPTARQASVLTKNRKRILWESIALGFDIFRDSKETSAVRTLPLPFRVGLSLQPHSEHLLILKQLRVSQRWTEIVYCPSNYGVGSVCPIISQTHTKNTHQTLLVLISAYDVNQVTCVSMSGLLSLKEAALNISYCDS